MDTPEISKEMEWFLEQLEAAEEMVHTYKCFYCQMATAQEIIVIISEEGGGTRVKMVGICDTCGKED